MPITPELLDRDMEVIRQKRGDASVIRMASESLSIDRIPLPEFPTLMRITSARDKGGIPIGCVTRIYGTPSAGKTQLAYWIIRAAQRLRTKRFPNGMQCCYWNVESQFDKDYAQSLGIDTTKLVLRDTDVIEEIAEEMQILLRSCHLHVIDSASHATSVEQLALDPKDWRSQRGVHAAAWKSAITHIHHWMDKESNTIIIIDHEVTTQQGLSEPLSGQRMAFRSDLSIQVSRGAWLFYNDKGVLVNNDELKDKTKNAMGAAGLKEADGSEITIRVPKARICRPLRVGKMRLDLHKMRFDTAFELADHGLYYDLDGQEAHRSGNATIITNAPGSWYWCPRWVVDEPADGKRKAKGHWSWAEDEVEKINGKVALRNYITATPELQELIITCIQKEGSSALTT
jgi:RecA/RadA recombinase